MLLNGLPHVQQFHFDHIDDRINRAQNLEVLRLICRQHFALAFLLEIPPQVLVVLGQLGDQGRSETLQLVESLACAFREKGVRQELFLEVLEHVREDLRNFVVEIGVRQNDVEQLGVLLVVAQQNILRELFEDLLDFGPHELSNQTLHFGLALGVVFEEQMREHASQLFLRKGPQIADEVLAQLIRLLLELVVAENPLPQLAKPEKKAGILR